MKITNRFRTKIVNRESGFTLIEILVVILIIGILAAIAIAMFMNQRESAIEASVKSDLRNAGTVYQGSYQNGKGYDRVSLTQMPMSKGNSITVATLLPSTEGFCLIGNNASSPSNFMFYNSNNGGITDNIDGCVDSSNENDGTEDEISQCSPNVLAYVNADKKYFLNTINTIDLYPLINQERSTLNETQKVRYDEIYAVDEAYYISANEAHAKIPQGTADYEFLEKKIIASRDSYMAWLMKNEEYMAEANNIDENLQYNDPEKISQLREEANVELENFYSKLC